MKYRNFILTIVLISALFLVTGCQKVVTVTVTAPASSTSPAPTAPAITSKTPSSTTGVTNPASNTTIPTSVKPAVSSAPVTNLSPLNVGTISKINVTSSAYVVFAWNDLGMHCLNPTYDTAVILPPYNTVWAQVVKRGNPPQIVTQGITVEYRIVNNTTSANKSTFGQFWDNMKKLFGISLPNDKGLNLSNPAVNNGLSGKMEAASDHFEVVGIPLTPVDDSNIWNPYQVVEITVKNSGNQIIAQTRAMAPVSSEMNCAKCHGADTYNDILVKHDKLSGTNLLSQKPVLCASCHGDPALGATSAGQAGYLSQKIHGFHAGLATQPTCYDCHPGQVTNCSRSLAHTSSDGNCTTCHGTLTNVSTSITQGRVPWVSEPRCVSCHPGVAQVDTSSTLYRNAEGHGGIYCASCHSSPHAMVPTSQQADNYQALQYQGKAVPIGDCAACHHTSRGEQNLREYLEKHGGTNPEKANGCYICHTSINTTDTTQWPHSFQWKSR
jgi:hypothetical protein